MQIYRLYFLILLLSMGYVVSYGGRFQDGHDDLSLAADSLPEEVSAVDTLDNLVVTASLITRRGNEDIVTVTKDMRKNSHNAGELLGKLQGMHYNPMSTQLTYNGSKNIVILVDSIEKDESFIKRLNPDRFDRINVIHSPVGKYEGYDAVISLHTKRRYVGYEGGLIGQLNSCVGSSNGEGKALSNLLGMGQFIYTREKLNFDIFCRWEWNRSGLDELVATRFPLNGYEEMTNESNDKNPNKYLWNSRSIIDLSFDYEFNSNHSISAKFKVAPSWSHDAYAFDMLRINQILQTVESVLQHRTLDIDNKIDYVGGLWYRGNLRGWMLNASMTYNNTGYDRLYNISNSSGYMLEDNRTVRNRYLALSADVTRWLADQKWMISLADDFVKSDFDDRRKESNLCLSSSNDLRNTLNFSTQFLPDSRFSLGANVGFAVMKNKYLELSESHLTPCYGAQMSWRPNERVFLRANYSAKVAFPALSTIQNLTTFTDSLVSYTGNPDLRPTLTHEASLNLSLLNMINLSGQFSHAGNTVSSIVEAAYGQLPTGATTDYASFRYQNSSSTYWKVNINFYKDVHAHWQISANAGVEGRAASYKDYKESLILPTYDWYVMYHALQGSLQVILSGSMTPNVVISPQMKMWNTEDVFALAVTKYLFNYRLQLLAMWQLPLHICSGKWHGGLKSQPYVTQYWGSNQWRHNNSLQFSFVYTFNGGQSVKRYNRQSVTVDI